ncbi:MAG: flavin reductase [Bacillota bacterium]
MKDEARLDNEGRKPSSSPVVPVVEGDQDVSAGLYSLTYGMFVVSSRLGDKLNAQTCNTVFQVTGEPPRVAVGINKKNFTHELIRASNVLCVTVFGKGNMRDIKWFGFRSGREVDKFSGREYMLSPNIGCPVVPSGVAYLECRVRPEMSSDVGTHTLFIADVVGGGRLTRKAPVTYDFYRANRAKPEEEVDDVERVDVIAALNLEYGANRRYQHQIEDLPNPRLVAVLEGIKRAEGDHVENALRWLLSKHQDGNGFSTALLHMKMNLEFEEVAWATYTQFAAEVEDPELRAMFADQARSEMGHINIFRDLVKALQEGDYPVAFFCPLCGWELYFGTRPEEGQAIQCGKCGATFKIWLSGGDWRIERQS